MTESQLLEAWNHGCRTGDYSLYNRMIDLLWDAPVCCEACCQDGAR